jgi:hypothetical protein
MSSRLLVPRPFVAIAFATVAVLSAKPASAGPINFDSVAVPAGTCVDATGYLSGFGITFSTLNAGATPAICSGSTTTIPVSLPNFFFVIPAVGQNNLPLSYSLAFDEALDSISFFRAGQTTPSTGPIWTATAFDSFGNIVGTPVGEPFITFNPTAQQYTISGTDIRSMTIDADNLGFASVNNPPFDDFNLVPSAVPEPSILLLCVLAGVAAERRRRRGLGRQ